jgi:DNA repair photolyase
MTITTDSEKVRKVFEPLCPSNTIRLKAIKEVNTAGINTCITMTPLLPIENAEDFAKTLLNTGINKFVIQPFHSDRGKFVAGTREAAMMLIRNMNWNMDKYNHVFQTIQKYIPNIGIGKDGFAPI